MAFEKEDGDSVADHKLLEVGEIYRNDIFGPQGVKRLITDMDEKTVTFLGNNDFLLYIVRRTEFLSITPIFERSVFDGKVANDFRPDDEPDGPQDEIITPPDALERLQKKILEQFKLPPQILIDPSHVHIEIAPDEKIVWDDGVNPEIVIESRNWHQDRKHEP